MQYLLWVFTIYEAALHSLLALQAMCCWECPVIEQMVLRRMPNNLEKKFT